MIVVVENDNFMLRLKMVWNLYCFVVVLFLVDVVSIRLMFNNCIEEVLISVYLVLLFLLDIVLLRKDLIV